MRPLLQPSLHITSTGPPCTFQRIFQPPNPQRTLYKGIPFIWEFGDACGYAPRVRCFYPSTFGTSMYITSWEIKVCHNHLKQPKKNWRNPVYITKGLVTCHCLGLISNVTGWLWWTPEIVSESACFSFGVLVEQHRFWVCVCVCWICWIFKYVTCARKNSPLFCWFLGFLGVNI